MSEFKVGDVVYDCVLFPDDVGEVFDIKIGYIEILFDKHGSRNYYHNGAYYKSSIPTLKKHKYEIDIKSLSPKLGDEGLFWNDAPNVIVHGIVYGIDSCGSDYRRYQPKGSGALYANFKPMTKQEFDKIKEL